MRVLRILLFILCLAVSVMAQDTPADNWAQFRGNHSLTGVSNSNVPTSLKQSGRRKRANRSNRQQRSLAALFLSDRKKANSLH